MNERQRTVLIFIILAGSLMPAHAQLATTQAGGLAISAEQVFLSGNSRDLDCSVAIKFTGGLAGQAIGVSHVKVIRAVGQDGGDLIRSNRPTSPPSAKWLSGLGAFYQLVPLKAPSSDGKSIRKIEAEVELCTPTAANGGLLILSNATAHPGEALSHPETDRYHITLTYHTMESFKAWQTQADKDSPTIGAQAEKIRTSFFPGILNDPDGAPRKRVTFLVQDTEQELVNLGIQTTDGGMIKNPRAISWSNVAASLYGFDFDAKPPLRLNLVVYVAVPKATQTIRFVLENIAVPPLSPR